ncbi:MAG: hypothetical protein WCY32_09185, partial [Burkholderiaceae bacterium]
MLATDNRIAVAPDAFPSNGTMSPAKVRGASPGRRLVRSRGAQGSWLSRAARRHPHSRGVLSERSERR